MLAVASFSQISGFASTPGSLSACLSAYLPVRSVAMQAPFYAGATAAEAKAKANARRWGSMTSGSGGGGDESTGGTSSDYVHVDLLDPDAAPKAKAKPSPPSPPVAGMHKVSLSDDEDMPDPPAEVKDDGSTRLENPKSEAKVQGEGEVKTTSQLKRERRRQREKAEKEAAAAAAAVDGAAASGASSSAGASSSKVKVEVEAKPKAKTEPKPEPKAKAEPKTKDEPDVSTRLEKTKGKSEEEGDAEEEGKGEVIPERYRTQETPLMVKNEQGEDVPKPSWVQCERCKGWNSSFKYMTSEKLFDNNDDSFRWVRCCVACLVYLQGTSVSAAVGSITSVRVRPERERRQAFKQAVANVQQSFDFVACTIGEEAVSSKTKIKALARTSFVKIFAPWHALIALKAQSLEAAAGCVAKFDAVAAALKDAIKRGASSAEIDGITSHLDELEKEVAEAGRMLAFRSKGQDQSAWLFACEYADEWINYAGFRLRSYYRCADACGAVIPSKVWTTKHADPLATKQAWYCNACNRRYKWSWGQLVEMSCPNGEVMYARSFTPPPKDVEDIRALAIERETNAQSPHELYTSLKSHAPVTGTMVARKPTEVDFYWASPQDRLSLIKSIGFITAEGLAALEQTMPFDWTQIFNRGK